MQKAFVQMRSRIGSNLMSVVAVECSEYGSRRVDLNRIEEREMVN
jgi:hypothetical protein